MKSSSSLALSLYFALLMVFLTVSVLIFFDASDSQNHVFIICSSAILVFVVSALIFNYFMNKFILKKIKPIYKSIINSGEINEKLNILNIDYDLISIAKNDVDQFTEKKSAEIEQLKQLEKYRREFLGNVSHELKTPIFNIQGYVLTLLDGGLEDETINRQYLERTEKSINRLISIVKDLETISTLESTELKLNLLKFDLAKLVEEVFELLERRSKDQKIKLRMINSEKDNWFVFADKERIFEVVNNLVVNSIIYGKSNGTTSVELNDLDNHILIQVSDDGIGIEEHIVPRIFERFYRVDKSRSRDLGGTGLGLAIVKHILEAHNQKINVRSKLGEGTSFSFSLPKAN